MAERFNYKTVYDSISWVVIYTNAQGYQDKFLETCQEIVAQSDFPNIDSRIEEYQSGGVFFNKEFTPMLAVTFKKSQFQQLGTYFRAQQFGNLMYFTLMKTIDSGFWDTAIGGEFMLTKIRSKCKNLAQWEEFSSLVEFGELVFWKAIQKIDPEWKENKQLLRR